MTFMMTSLDAVILGILWREPLHVYRFLEEVRKLPHGPWSHLKRGVWYHHFERLEREGKILSHAPIQEGGRPPRRTYRLERAGEECLVRWLARSHLLALEEWSLVVSFLHILTPAEQSRLLQRRERRLRRKFYLHEDQPEALQSWLEAQARAQRRWIRAYLSQVNAGF